MIRGTFGDFREDPRHIGDDFDDDDLEDETLTERLVGLTEMFPDSVRSALCSAAYFGLEGGKWLFNASRTTLWVLASSATILALPIMFENERSQMEQSQLQQQRQMLLGPNVAVSSGGPSPMPVMPPPTRA